MRNLNSIATCLSIAISTNIGFVQTRQIKDGATDLVNKTGASRKSIVPPSKKLCESLAKIIKDALERARDGVTSKCLLLQGEYIFPTSRLPVIQTAIDDGNRLVASAIANAKGRIAELKRESQNDLSGLWDESQFPTLNQIDSSYFRCFIQPVTKAENFDGCFSVASVETELKMEFAKHQQNQIGEATDKIKSKLIDSLKDRINHCKTASRFRGIDQLIVDAKWAIDFNLNSNQAIAVACKRIKTTTVTNTEIGRKNCAAELQSILNQLTGTVAPVVVPTVTKPVAPVELPAPVELAAPVDAIKPVAETVAETVASVSDFY